MRTEGQVKQQLKQVAFRHLQRRLRENFRRRPESCCHNCPMLLDGETSVRVCGLLTSEGKPRNIPCDSRLPGGPELARDCSLWEPLQSKDDIKRAFADLLRSEDRGFIAAQYPDIAALLWVLDTPPTEGEVQAVVEKASESSSPETHGLWSFIRRLGGGT